MKRVIFAAVAVGVLGLATPAGAQQTCLPHDQAIEALAEAYGEQVVGVGIAGEGEMVIELLVAENGSWTLLSTRTDGTSCVVGSGESWATLPKPKFVAEEPA